MWNLLTSLQPATFPFPRQITCEYSTLPPHYAIPFMNPEYGSEAKHGTATSKYVIVLYSTQRIVEYMNTSLLGFEYFKKPCYNMAVHTGQQRPAILCSSASI